MKNHNDELTVTIKVVMAALGQSQSGLAVGIGMSQSALNRKVVGKSTWGIQEVGRMSEFWGCQLSDLLAGPEVALRQIIGKAPRQRDRVSAA